MTKPLSADVTQLLLDWSKGDQAALNKLTLLAYPKLRRLANSFLRRERFDQTLQGTELVHEAYMRMADHAGLTESRLALCVAERS